MSSLKIKKHLDTIEKDLERFSDSINSNSSDISSIQGQLAASLSLVQQRLLQSEDTMSKEMIPEKLAQMKSYRFILIIGI